MSSRRTQGMEAETMIIDWVRNYASSHDGRQPEIRHILKAFERRFTRDETRWIIDRLLAEGKLFV